MTDRLPDSRSERLVYRHSLLVRITHWVGAVSLVLLLMSGLQILNAHPSLYWGNASNFAHPVASIDIVVRHGNLAGVTNVLGYRFVTTGVLGLSGPPGARLERAFPSWATLPTRLNLASGRHWHFFFAWILVLDGLVYFSAGLFGGHIWRDLVPSRGGIKHVGRSILDHLRLRFPRGDEARHYNVLQQLSYLLILFIVLPTLVLTGLSMSPGLDAAFPFLISLLGGRQTARTIHFIAATALFAFVTIHILMVVLSGVWNNMRSIITGWYVIKPVQSRHGL